MLKNCDSAIFYFSLFSVNAMCVLGSTAIAPSLPNMELHFSDIKSVELLSKLILTLPAIFVVIFSPISGILYDKMPRLKILFPAMIGWSVSGFIAFFLDNIYFILFTRALFGIATAFVMTGASALLADYYKGAKRERALSIQGFFTAFGGGLFLVIGGLLSNINWRFPFLVYLLGFVIFIFAFKNLFEPPKVAPKAIKPSSNAGIFAFIPIYILGFFGMAAFYIVPTQVPFFITDILKKGGEFIGISLATSSIFTAISSLFYARFRRYFSLSAMYGIGFFLMAIGFFMIFVFHNFFMLFISLIFTGSALGILLVTNSSWLFCLTDENNRAKAYGFLASAIFLGQFLSPFLTQPIVNKYSLLIMFLVFSLILGALGMIFCVRAIYRAKF